MRRELLILATLSALTAGIVVVPRFSARQIEANRMEALRTLASSEKVARAGCPVGDDLDAFLSRIPKQDAPWEAACREVPLATGKVTVVQESRAAYAECRSYLATQSQAACALIEPLQFLAAPETKRSVARMKLADAAGQTVVWTTPQSLAWGSHLVDEHRFYLLLILSCFAFTSLLTMTARHGRNTYVVQQRTRSSVCVPACARFWLLFFLHPYAQSLPVDYEDDYERWLEETDAAQAAVRYWQQVRGSLPDLAAMWLRDWARRYWAGSFVDFS